VLNCKNVTLASGGEHITQDWYVVWIPCTMAAYARRVPEDEAIISCYFFGFEKCSCTAEQVPRELYKSAKELENVHS
jgi:hypothetical protein